jgi:putative Mn2+ efflux pump MntP
MIDWIDFTEKVIGTIIIVGVGFFIIWLSIQWDEHKDKSCERDKTKLLLFEPKNKKGVGKRE